MNAARLRKREERIQAAAVLDERRRVKAEYGLTAATLALLRAKYGSGPVPPTRARRNADPWCQCMVLDVHAADGSTAI
jgi:hypothetical protein